MCPRKDGLVIEAPAATSELGITRLAIEDYALPQQSLTPCMGRELGDGIELRRTELIQSIRLKKYRP